MPEDSEGDAWEAVGRRQTWARGEERRGELDRALYQLLEPLRSEEFSETDRDEIDAADVRAVRHRLDEMRDFVETVTAELADGVEPWGDGGGSTVPYGVFREQLESAGYEVRRPSATGPGGADD